MCMCVCVRVCVFVRRSVRVRGSKNLQKDSGGLHSQQEEEGQRGETKQRGKQRMAPRVSVSH